jgi:hypothetical protein
MKSRACLLVILCVALATGLTAPQTTKADRPIDLELFGRLIRTISEPEGYFDSDNFISNEAGYLKILPAFARLGIQGGVYLGVGPDQNYSYIAEIKPRLAFIIDIRRQNVLEHLYFKSLFQLSANRIEYLERLFGRALPRTVDRRRPANLEALLDLIPRIPFDTAFASRNLDQALGLILTWNYGAIPQDPAAIRHIAQAFFEAGPDLKFTSYGRQPRPYHPTFRALLLETDSSGAQTSFLAQEERFQFVKAMHRENRIIPVVGDLSGQAAMSRVGQEVRRRGLQVKCFYVSNVEFYLFRGERWHDYIDNVSSLPLARQSYIIRSCSNMWHPHPARLQGYYMTTLMQDTEDFLHNEAAGRNGTYWDMVTLDYIAR